MAAAVALLRLTCRLLIEKNRKGDTENAYRVAVQWFNHMTLQWERSGGQGSIPCKIAPSLERNVIRIIMMMIVINCLFTVC